MTIVVYVVEVVCQSPVGEVIRVPLKSSFDFSPRVSIDCRLFG